MASKIRDELNQQMSAPNRQHEKNIKNRAPPGFGHQHWLNQLFLFLWSGWGGFASTWSLHLFSLSCLERRRPLRNGSIRFRLFSLRGLYLFFFPGMLSSASRQGFHAYGRCRGAYPSCASFCGFSRSRFGRCQQPQKVLPTQWYKMVFFHGNDTLNGDIQSLRETKRVSMVKNPKAGYHLALGNLQCDPGRGATLVA